MLINQSLSNMSDVAFQTAFVFYAVALVLSLVYYGKMQSVIDARRAFKRAAAAQPSRTPAFAHAGGTDLGDVEVRNAELSAPEAADGVAKENDAEVRRAGGEGGVAKESSAGEGEMSREEMLTRERAAGKWAGMAQGLVWVGVILHIAAVILRGFAVNRFPLGNLYEYMLMVTAMAMAVAAAILSRKDWRIVWPWLLTPVLALMYYGGTELYSQSAPVVPALQSNWLPIHVTTVSLGASIGLLSGMVSILYLLRIWQPRGQERGFFGAVAKPLPSAKALDGFAYKSAIVTLPVLGLGILLGAIWAESAWGRFWGWDPKETFAFISWILYAAYLHARATVGWRDWRAALINVAALATMIFNLFFINLVVSGLHSYAGLN